MWRNNEKASTLTAPIAVGKSDIYSARFAREHAFNKAVAYFLYVQVPLTGITYALLRFKVIAWQDAFYSLFLALFVSLIAYGRCLESFTDEARDIIWEKEMNTGKDIDGDGVVGKPNLTPVDNSQMTVLAGVRKSNTLIFRGMALTESQIKAIVDTALKAKTLTVNYLESLGLSRQQAESFRMQLVRHNLAEFDQSGRVKIFDEGLQMFENNK